MTFRSYRRGILSVLVLAATSLALPSLCFGENLLFGRWVAQETSQNPENKQETLLAKDVVVIKPDSFDENLSVFLIADSGERIDPPRLVKTLHLPADARVVPYNSISGEIGVSGKTGVVVTLHYSLADNFRALTLSWQDGPTTHYVRE